MLQNATTKAHALAFTCFWDRFDFTLKLRRRRSRRWRPVVHGSGWAVVGRPRVATVATVGVNGRTSGMARGDSFVRH